MRPSPQALAARPRLAIVVGALGMLLVAGDCPPAPTTLTLEQRANRLAPWHYQDVDDYDNAREVRSAPADFITRFNYDGNANGLDNWHQLEPDLAAYREGSHVPSGPPAYAYYSIAETSTHWFIVYMFFHPRDWDDHGDDEHENDTEGLLEIVRKDGTVLGRLDGIVTVFHNDFYSYVPEGSPLEDGFEDVDGRDLSIVVGHPRTAQESKGHGIKAWPHIEDFTGAADQDGVIYRPGEEAEVPDSANDRFVSYQLIDIFAPTGLWFYQLQQLNAAEETPGATTPTYEKWGVLQGDESGGCGGSGGCTEECGGSVGDCTEDRAHLPWSWDDDDDGRLAGFIDIEPVLAGEMALDPAHLACIYFDGDEFATTYMQNRYISDMKAGIRPIPGWPSSRVKALYDRVPADPNVPTCS